MGQPVTTNPFIIMLINMTVVFAVLWGLSLIVRLIQVIDPTKKNQMTSHSMVETAATLATPTNKQDDETFILIAAALAAYGYTPSQIVSIRPAGSQLWKQAARIETVQARNQMYS